MIFKLDHQHSQKDQQIVQTSIQQAFVEIKCPQFLRQLLTQSQKVLGQKSRNQIKQMQSHKQKKVYESLTSNETNYLAVMFQKADPSQQSYIKQLMSSRQGLIMDRIIRSQIQIKQQEDNDNKIKRIRNQLDFKIKEMKKQLGDLGSNNDSQDKQALHRSRTNSSLVILQDFKKKQYWKDNSFTQQSRRVKSFLSKIKKEKSQVQQRFNQDLQSRLKRLQQSKQTQQKRIKQERHRQYLQNLQKQYKNKSLRRKQHNQEKQHKKKQVQVFLQSIKTKEPTHLRLQNDFKALMAKHQQHRQKALKQLKEKHPNYDAQEIEEHMSQYMDKKERYYAEKELKAQKQEQIENKRQQQLQDLFHGKFHQQIVDNKKVKSISHLQLKNNRKKVQQYASTVKQNFKPSIDKRKKKQVSDIIRFFQLSNDPTKKKIVKGNGVNDFQDKKQNDSYQKGVSYLEQIRSMNEVNRSRVSSSRKYDSALDISVSTVKKIDYLRESRPSLNLKHTISDWKNLLSKKQFTTKDKLQRVLERAQSLQIHARQKQVQLRNMKKQQNAMDIKEQSDKYYLECVAARMVLLKDVVMN